MTMRKYGRGEIIPEPGDDLQKEGATKEWTPEDESALQEEGEDDA